MLTAPCLQPISPVVVEHATVNEPAATRTEAFGSHPVVVPFQIGMACVEIAIIVFFIIGPVLNTGPSYLIIDCLVAGLIACELSARAFMAPDLRYWLGRLMTWVGLAILATLRLPTLLSNVASCAPFASGLWVRASCCAC